jgi:protein MPE1
VPTDAALACPLCSKLLKAAVRTPCCSTLYCEECIQTHLIEHDFQCAECERRIADLTKLKADDQTREAVRAYVDAELAKSERERGEGIAPIAPIAAPKEPKSEAAAVKTEQADAASSGTGAAGPAKHSLPARPADAQGGADNDASAPSEGAAAQAQPAPMPLPEVGGVQWSPQAAQQIVMMLANPTLPPPMRMQLQMQLQLMQMAFLRTQQQQQQNGAAGSGEQQYPQPQWAGGMSAPGGMGMGMGMGMGGPWQQQQQQQQGARPPASNPFVNQRPPSNADSAYMRVPIANK